MQPGPLLGAAPGVCIRAATGRAGPSGSPPPISAAAEIGRLKVECGPLMFFQSGGCCDGSLTASSHMTTWRALGPARASFAIGSQSWAPYLFVVRSSRSSCAMFRWFNH